MAGVIDFSIRVSQQIVGDDALGKLQKLENQIARESTTIAGMESKLVSARKRLEELMAGGASGKGANIAAVDKMREAIAKLEGDIGKKKGGLDVLLGGLSGAQGAARLEAQTAASTAALEGFLGTVTAGAAIVAAFALALGAVVLSLASFALGAANAHRSALLMMGALAGSAEAGTANVEAIDRVADSTALAKGQIEQIGKRLAVAGIDGQRFETTLGAISTATALLGESAGSHLEGIIEKSKGLGHFQFSDRQLKGLGLSFGDLAAQVGMTEAAFKAAMKAGQISVEQGVDAINAAIGKRFGGGSAGLLLGFDVQILKLKEHVTALFKDVNIEPFLVALHDLLSVFDKSTDSGEALHFMVTQGFNAMFDAVVRIEPYAKAFFQGMIIGALLLYIGFVKVKRALEDAFGGDSMGGLDGIEVAMYAGIAVVGLFVGALVAAALILAVIFYPVIMIIMQTVDEVAELSAQWDLLTAAFDSIQLPDLGGAGESMIAGLIDAVLGGAPSFFSAMATLGGEGMKGLNSIFHFGSPSRAMEQRGEWIDEGGARGVENQGAMRRAMSGMASPADARRGDDGGRAASKGPTTIYIDARGADKGAVDYLLSKLADAFEGATVLAGVAPEPAPS